MALPTAASVVSSGLAGYPSVYFDKTAVATLQSNLALYGGCEMKTMPDRSGVVLQIFDHSKMAANTTPATEGTPGAGQSITQNTRQITLDNYVDYISISNKVDKTMLIDQGAAAAKLLGYRGALSVDTVISEVLDTAATADATTNIDIATGTYLSAADLRQAAFGLAGVDVKPKSNGSYYGVLHNLVVFDVVNDATTGGFQDNVKYTSKDALANGLGLAGSSPVLKIAQTEFYQSNAVKTYANWQASANTAYAGWVIGQDAIFCSSLGKTQLGQKNFSVSYRRFDEGNSIDPAGMIRAAVVYNFFFGAAKRPGSTNGFRRIRSESSIA